MIFILDTRQYNAFTWVYNLKFRGVKIALALEMR